MARGPRLVFPGVALHVRQRGVNRVACFRSDRDYLTYLAHLRHVVAKYRCELHAYCLMTNHVHLLLTPADGWGCGRMMQDLGRCYVPYFNRKHERTGTLWEGRFRSCLVESAEYVIALHRYIESNPVRAGMVGAARHYPWSSHATNTGTGADPMIKRHCELLAFTNSAYGGLFEEPLGEDMLRTIREATEGGYPLASDAYKSAVLQPLGVRMAPGKPGPRVERHE